MAPPLGFGGSKYRIQWLSNAGIINVGVDIAKLSHFSSAISSDGEILIEPFKFTNDADAFQMLFSKLISLNAEPDSIIIGPESMAHYYDNLVRYLVAENFQVCV